VADDAWTLAEAKAKFSEVVEKALREGPQHVTRHGRPAVVVVPEDEWARVCGPKKSLVDVLFDPSIRGLLSEEERQTLFARDKGPGRPIEF
jgi:prevent-host-death family protein